MPELASARTQNSTLPPRCYNYAAVPASMYCSAAIHEPSSPLSPPGRSTIVNLAFLLGPTDRVRASKGMP
jgi:hypothetical protein